MPDWPHSPRHCLGDGGSFMVTAGTYKKLPLFNTRARLDLIRSTLFATAQEFDAALQAWAIFPNHYHFVANFKDGRQLRSLVSKLHTATARRINERDATRGRKVWFQYWETRLTYQSSYFVRLHYVHANAVHHGIVPVAAAYEWCSAAWFERLASPAFRKTVLTHKISRLKVLDDFPVSLSELSPDAQPSLECGGPTPSSR
jgi:putative transposase